MLYRNFDLFFQESHINFLSDNKLQLNETITIKSITRSFNQVGTMAQTAIIFLQLVQVIGFESYLYSDLFSPLKSLMTSLPPQQHLRRIQHYATKLKL